jgi:hypothetical protein
MGNDYDYAPVAYYDDEDELLKKGGYAPAVPPAPDPAPAAASVAPYPAVGSTEDLESKAGARFWPYAPAAPSVGSTEDLESLRASHDASMSEPRAAAVPVPRPQWKDYAPPEQHGWSRFGHALAAINPITNHIFNEMPEQRAEERYKNATAEYEAPIADAAKEAETEQKESAAEKDRAEANAKLHPQPKEGLTPEETTIHDLMTGNNGGPRVNPATGKPYSHLDAYTAVQQAKADTKPEKTPNDFEQYYADWLKDNRFPDTAHNRLLARSAFAAAGQAPQRPQQQLVVTPDGKVIEVKPGMTIPAGSKTVSGDLAGAKPNAEELKRSEMAENMEENLAKLEDIVKRRPELFGPLNGRLTQGKMMLGSDDPDIGALNTIKDQIGMAQQSAHSMRSAQHVEAAAASILNGFKNGPDAINSSIKTARDSLKTFTKDVQEGNPSTKKSGSEKPQPSGKSVSLAAARQLPVNKGKSDEEIKKDIEAHGHTVVD